MQLEIKIKEDGKWRNPTSEEFTGTLDYRIALLAKKETVIKMANDDIEIILATGDWVDHYKKQGKITLSLVELAELLAIYPTIDKALKVLGGEILVQQTLFT